MTTYLLSVHHTEGHDPYPTPEEMQQQMEETQAVTERMREQGVWVFAGGLHPVDSATVVDNARSGGVVTTDGPFAEAKEHIAGFWIINAADLDDALRWAADCSAACRLPVEVRPFDEHSQV